MGAGNFCYGIKDSVLDNIMKFRVVSSVTKGDDEELPSGEEFPLAYEVKVNVFKWGGGVGVIDLRHCHIGVVV